VRVHNHRAADWAVLVTILGWLLLVGGLVRMLFPIFLAGMAASLGESTGLIVGEAVVFLVVGRFLSYKAYSPTRRERIGMLLGGHAAGGRSLRSASHSASSRPLSAGKRSSSTCAEVMRSTRKLRKSVRSSHHAPIKVTST